MAKRRGIVRELAAFMLANKTYWLVPIAVVLLILAVLVAISVATGGAIAPFIYTLF